MLQVGGYVGRKESEEKVKEELVCVSVRVGGYEVITFGYCVEFIGFLFGLFLFGLLR